MRFHTADLVDADDVRMLQGRRRHRLDPEPADVVRPGKKPVAQQLYRDFTTEPVLARPIDNTHAAARNLLDQLISCELDERQRPAPWRFIRLEQVRRQTAGTESFHDAGG